VDALKAKGLTIAQTDDEYDEMNIRIHGNMTGF